MIDPAEAARLLVLLFLITGAAMFASAVFGITAITDRLGEWAGSALVALFAVLGTRDRQADPPPAPPAPQDSTKGGPDGNDK